MRRRAHETVFDSNADEGVAFVLIWDSGAEQESELALDDEESERGRALPMLRIEWGCRIMPATHLYCPVAK